MFSPMIPKTSTPVVNEAFKLLVIARAQAIDSSK